MRLDLLDVAERDILFAICPDGRVAPDFSFRVDTSIFQTLAVERGWSGLLPPPLLPWWGSPDLSGRPGLGLTCCPPARHFEGEEEFDAGNAATSLDQIVTDRLTSDDYPVISVGQWTNFAELAHGFGRAFEEYKAAACCADEILAPNSVGNLGPFWSVLVSDTGSGEGDTAEEVGYDLLNTAPAEAGLSWLVNTFEVPAICLTGKRTPAGLGSASTAQGYPPFKLSGTDEFNQLTGMGDWWMNDYFAQPI
ncbi:hypothetical protein ACJJTC_014503 [Scirpophaga incertulas]